MVDLLLFLTFLYIFKTQKTVISGFMSVLYLCIGLFNLILAPEITQNNPEKLMVIYASINAFACFFVVTQGLFFMSLLFILNIFLCLQITLESFLGAYVLNGPMYYLAFYTLCVLEIAATYGGGRAAGIGRFINCIVSFLGFRSHSSKGL